MDFKMFEVRWHSRAGHGAITAAIALGDILGNEGYKVQTFPEFGAEKRGAEVTVFNRFTKDKELIFPVCKVEHAEAVLLLDQTLINSNELSYEDITSDIPSDGFLIVNTSQTKTKFSEFCKTYLLDATKISTEEIGRNIPNVPMLGALVAISKLIDTDKFKGDLETWLSTSKLPKEVIAGNIKAFERGASEFSIS